MAKKEDLEYTGVEEVQDSAPVFDLKKYMRLLWHYKYWILASVVVCMVVSYGIYKRKAPVYNTSAEVMLLYGNEEGAASGNGALNALADMNGFSNRNLNFFNELEVMHSPSLMKAVIERLNLMTTYKTEGFGHEMDLYGTSPILVEFYDLPVDSAASMTLYKSHSGTLIATDFTVNGKPRESKPLRLRPGTMVKTPLGVLSVTTTSNYENFPDKIHVDKASEQQLADDLSEAIVPTKKSDDNTVAVLTFNDVSEKRAIDIINALIVAYQDLWVTEKKRSSVNTSNFIADRLIVLEKELSGIDADISAVKSSSQVADFQAAASTYYSQSMKYDTKAFEANTQLNVAQYLRDYIVNPAHQDDLIPANTGTSGVVETQIQEYNSKMAKRDALLQNSTESNPVIAQLNSDLQASRALILASINNLISTTRNQVNRAESADADYANRVSAVPQQEKMILSIERQQKVKENLYLYLLQKREENELNSMLAVSNTRILRAATGNGIVSGGLLRALLIGFVIGLLIPMAIIYLQMRFDTRVKGKDDILALKIPFLGELPITGRRNRWRRWLNRKSRKQDDKELKLVVKSGSRSVVNEAFRMIRTNLDFMSRSQRGSEVIMITSYNPGSGKTFISINLAKSLSLKGKKVILVDMDLRRASLSKFTGSRAKGVTTFLTGKENDVMSLVRTNAGGTGMDVLSSGPIPPNPVELIISDRFPEMVDILKEHYDYVVLDCPPYDLVADTAIISKVADMSIFVIRAGLFRKDMLLDLEDIYESKKLPHMGVILNGVQQQDAYYGKRYGYGYGYGYGSYYGKDTKVDEDPDTDEKVDNFDSEGYPGQDDKK